MLILVFYKRLTHSGSDDILFSHWRVFAKCAHLFSFLHNQCDWLNITYAFFASLVSQIANPGIEPATFAKALVELAKY